MHRSQHIHRTLVAGALLLAALFVVVVSGPRPSSGQAASFTVTSADDAGPNTLRDAIDQANQSSGAATIAIDAGVGPITLTGGELAITDDVTITGQGASATVISGGETSRILNINTGVTVALQNLTVADGNAVDESGGAMLNAGNLTLEAVLVRNSQATFSGGGIANTGNLTLNNSTVTTNTVVLDHGGGIHSDGGTVTLTRSTLSDNRVPKNGGGLYLATGVLTSTGSTVISNTVTSSTAGQGQGGGIFMATGTRATFTGSTFQANTAVNGGGGLYAQRGTISSFADGTIQNNQATAPLTEGGGIWSDGTLSLTNMTVQTNRSNFQGGGLYNGANGRVSIANSRFLANVADEGAGIFNERESGQITISGSRFANNVADTTATNGLSGDGGAIYSFREAVLSISDSEIVNNQAAGDGAGIYSEGVLTATGLLVQNNVTIDSGIDRDATGGGLFLNQRSTTLISNSQILSNTARGPGGGIARQAPVAEFAPSLRVISTTISGNVAQTDAPETDNKLGGGGLLVSGQAELTNVTISDNRAAAGGGIFLAFDDITLTNVSLANNSVRAVTIPAPIGGGEEIDPETGLGGGIFVSGEPSSLTMDASIIYSNTAAVLGGGLYLGSPNNALTNVTLDTNQAQNGGAIYKASFGIESEPGLELASVTMADNTATAAEGTAGLYNVNGFVGVRSTILANGDGSANCGGADTVFNSSGYNIDSGTSCGLAAQGATGDLSSTDPQLEPLAANGGPTLTRALQEGSPALSATSDAAAFCRATDQRGVTRPQGNGCDIGAFESALTGVSINQLFLPLIVRP